MVRNRPIVVVAEDYSHEALSRLGQCAEVVRLACPTPSELASALADADALLVRTQTRVSPEVIAAAPHLKVIARGGVGVENIDLAAAAGRGIHVVYTPAAATRAAAELTIGLILALERKIVSGDARVRTGDFAGARRDAVGRELGECVLGIIGMGRIGGSVGRMASAGFGTRVIYNDIREIPPLDFPAEPVSKEDLYAQADIVTLHVPLTKLTLGLIEAAALAQFRPTTTLINTARGAVLDAKAVAQALHERRLAGAAIDVFDPEPPSPDHPLLHAPNVIVSPHAAARSHAGLARMNDVVEDVIAVLEGRPPRFAATHD